MVLSTQVPHIESSSGVQAVLPLLSPRQQRDQQRQLGAFYTPTDAAGFIADWAIRHDGERILEPSVGDGTFVHAINATARRRGLDHVRTVGIEIDPEAFYRVSRDSGIRGLDLVRDDFLAVSPRPVQAVVGNPPYVRLRHLPFDQRQRALDVANRGLAEPMEPSGSVWMPFILHAMRFLDTGGRLALVLPFDLTYVRYARPLWTALGQRFGSLRVLRSHQRLFPELLQDVVILLADDHGRRTDSVRFQTFERVDDLLRDRPDVDAELPLDAIVRGERVFVDALLGQELQTLLRSKVAAVTVPARSHVTFNIGYVAGDKTFFHPSPATVEQFAIPDSSLRPTLASARLLRGQGLWTSRLPADRTHRLFLPDERALSAGDQQYIGTGDAAGVSSAYKCRVRKPWFIVPGVRTPDIVLTVFSERPTLLVNDGNTVASNSLLCGYSRGATAGELASAWYSSLTLLQCELEVHALGGGVMVMVPQEAGNVRLPARVAADGDHLAAVDTCLRAGRTDDAYRAGDTRILTEQLGLTGHEVELIRGGIDTLTHWRTSARPNGAQRVHI